MNKELIWETIFGQVPSKANTYMAVSGADESRRIIKGSDVREYERNFLRQISRYKDMNIKGRFRLFIHVYESSDRYDLDNALKTVLDCLQYAHAIENDNTCAEISARKIVDRQHPRIMFAIEEIDKPLNLFEAWEKNDMPRMQYPQWRR
jgi:Holliday junction resolvase RusA-like endonuclease